MNALVLKIMPLDPQLGHRIALPQRMSMGASGVDVAAAIDEAMVLEAGERRLIPCGFAVQVPVGFEVQVRPRSGLAYKHGITVLNAPGTIDADYRGEVKVLLINLSQESYAIQPGERIAQLVVAPVVIAAVQVVEMLEETQRGAGGFGSTGSMQPTA